MSKVLISIGDCLESLRRLPEKCIHTCVTSPPYFGLRDYGVDGQIGLEATPDAFVARLVDVFREVRRVLRDDGTLWLNLGDSYASSPPGNKTQGVSAKSGLNGVNGASGRYRETLEAGHATKRDTSRLPGIKPKDLIGIPWRVAFALQADGWYLRQDIIWSKPNPMPESVRDRCTKAHEYLFLLSKSDRYFFDAEAIKEPGVIPAGTKGAKGSAERAAQSGVNSRPPEYKIYDGMRNRRSVWTVTTKPFKGAHFATFPPDLIEPCVLAGAPEKCCSVCGSPWQRERIDTGEPDPSYKGSSFSEGKTVARDGGDRTQKGARTVKVAGELKPVCDCDADAASSIVLDPFGGSGTTAGVALKHGRKAILCELNSDYVEMMNSRITSIAGMPPNSMSAEAKRIGRAYEIWDVC